MKKGQTHPSTYLYQDYIITAFLDLLQTKAFAKITITELCERANISRRTFYRHFKDLYDVAMQYSNDLMTGLSATLTEYLLKNEFANRREFARIFFNFLEPYSKIIACFQQNNLEELLFTAYITNLCMLPFQEYETKEKKAQPSPYFLAFLLGGLWSLLNVWIKNGCKKSPAELAEIAFP